MKKISFKFFFFICLGITFLSNGLSAQFSAELYYYNESSKYTIDISGHPECRAKIRCFYNGSPVAISEDNLALIHKIYPLPLKSVGSPDGEGWQNLVWTSAEFNTTYYQFYVTYNSEIVKLTGKGAPYRADEILLKDIDGKIITELKFKNVYPGGQVEKQFSISAINTASDDGRLRIDSVVCPEHYEYTWLGSIENPKEPPVDIMSGFFYRVHIVFKPKTKIYARKKFKIYYSNGQCKSLDLIENQFEIIAESLLQLKKPNGGELLAPCFKYPIEWEGQARELPTTIEYSTNSGQDWNFIESAQDSSFDWLVPNEPADECLVKIKQDYNQSYTYYLPAEENVPVRRLCYKDDGTDFISMNDKGHIVAWNLLNEPPDEKFKKNIGEMDYPIESARSKGLFYYDNSQKIVAAYEYRVSSPRSELDSIAFFNIDDEAPFKKIACPGDFDVKDMRMDSKGKLLALVPEFGSRIAVYSTEDQKFLEYEDFNCPIKDFIYSPTDDLAVVALMNGTVRILALPDYKIIKTIEMYYAPTVEKINISPDNKILGIGCSFNPNAIFGYRGNRAENYIVDIETEQVIQSSRITASDAVVIDFAPNSAYVLIGSEYQPQIILFNLPDDNYYADMPGHEGALTDFKISPDGHSIATCSFSWDNLKVRFFTYPEEDISDTLFSIGEPLMEEFSYDIEPKYFATMNEINISGKFCNIGDVPVILDDYRFFSGTHFKVKEDFIPDTVDAGECRDIILEFNPLDTGDIYDTLYIITCTDEYAIALNSKSLPRNLAYDESELFIGEACVWEKIEKEFVLFTNTDPVPIEISSLEMENQFLSRFQLLSDIRDTIIPPGGSLKIIVSFFPDKQGPMEEYIKVFHSGQVKYIERFSLKGRGVGTRHELSHDDLRFIPEIPSRKITIKNLENNDIRISGYETDIDGFFSVSTPLPINIKPGETKELEIVWNKQETEDVKFSLNAEPCNASIFLICGMYVGESQLSIPTVKADPRENASIKIEMKNKENMTYNGDRFLDAEISLNPRLFYPVSARCDYGSAKIISNEVIDDRRIIKVRAEGDFPVEGIAAEILGVAGLAESDTTYIDFNKSSIFWGESVATEAHSGLFRLINLSGSRRILCESAKATILLVSPNPAVNTFRLEFYAKEHGEYRFELVNSRTGSSAISKTLSVYKGLNIINEDVSSLISGDYKIIIRKDGESAVEKLLIVK